MLDLSCCSTRALFVYSPKMTSNSFELSIILDNFITASWILRFVLYFSIDQDHSPRTGKDVRKIFLSVLVSDTDPMDQRLIDTRTSISKSMFLERRTSLDAKSNEKVSLGMEQQSGCRSYSDAVVPMQMLDANGYGKGRGTEEVRSRVRITLRYFLADTSRFDDPVHSARCTRVPLNPRNRTTVVSCF